MLFQKVYIYELSPLKGTRNTNTTVAVNALPLDLGFYEPVHWKLSGLLGEMADYRSRAGEVRGEPGPFYAKKGKVSVNMLKGYGS